MLFVAWDKYIKKYKQIKTFRKLTEQATVTEGILLDYGNTCNDSWWSAGGSLLTSFLLKFYTHTWRKMMLPFLNYLADLHARAARGLADLARQEHTVTQQQGGRTQQRRPFVLSRAACMHSHTQTHTHTYEHMDAEALTLWQTPGFLIGSGHQI